MRAIDMASEGVAVSLTTSLMQRHDHPHPPPAQGGLNPPPINHQQSNYSQYTQDSDYGAPAAGAGAGAGAGYAAAVHGNVAPMPPQGPTVLSNQDFLARVEAAKADIRKLTSYISEIANAHQRTLSSTDSTSSSALESIVTQTQVLNTSIKDQIKFLETDAARSHGNNIKDSQVGQLKTSFKKQLEEYRNEEASYERRYREQIARQYRIVNPEATEEEVQEAANADWGNEGVFQTAVRPSSLHYRFPLFLLRNKANSIFDSSKPIAAQPLAQYSVLCALATTISSRLSVL